MTTAPLPDRIGPYRVLRAIARGGMAEVYEVQDTATGEHLALKLLMQTGVALARFNREYEAMVRINHPNIVRVYHYGMHGEQPWFTMELVAGTPVQAYAKGVGRPGSDRRNAEVIRIAHDLALALDHAHGRGLVHRDLKSANMLVLPDGRIKLIDFGSARVLDAESITIDGEFVGTFAYASPEQLMGRKVDHRSDLYSLGVLLYRLCTGKRPFEADDLHQLARLHIKVPPVPPRKLVPELPQGLEDIVLHLLAKKRRERPESGAAVARRLERLASQPLVLPGTLKLDITHNRLVGREEEQDLLRRFLDERRPGAVALIIGLPGSGRGGLLLAAERDARSRDWNVFSCVLEPGHDLMRLTVLLLQVTEGFGDVVSAKAIKATKVIEQVSRSRSMGAARRRDYLKAAGMVILRERHSQDGRPIVILMEGLHNAGAVAIDLLVGLREQLARHGVPVLFVADVDETRDHSEAPSRKRLPDAMRIHVPPLDAHRVALLVGALLHRRPPPTALALRIAQASGGMPEYVQEVLERMVESGILREQGRDANRLEWAQAGVQVEVPEAATGRLLAKLASLPAAHRRALEVLAILGDAVEPDLVPLAMGWEPEPCRMLLRDLRQLGWVRRAVRKRVRFLVWQQSLARTVVADRVRPCVQRLLIERVLERVLRGPPAEVQVRLLLAVGRVDDAVVKAVDIASTMLEAQRPASALEVLEPATHQVKGAKRITSERLAHLFLLHAQALLKLRPYDGQLSRSLERARLLGQGDVFRARTSMVRAELSELIGHFPNYRKFLTEAWVGIEQDPPPDLASTIATELGRSHALAGAIDSAARWHERAEELAMSAGSERLAGYAQVGTAELFLARGLLHEAEDHAVQAIEVFDELEDMHGLSMALPVWAGSLRLQGRFSQALEVLNSATPMFRQLEVPSLYVRVLLAQAWCEVEIGRLGRAQECIDELAATVGKGEHLILRLKSNLVRGRILVASGLLYEAGEVLTDLCTKAANAGLVVLSEHARALLAEALWESGEKSQARLHFDQARARLATAGDVPALMAACCACGRVMAHEIRPDKLFAPVASFLESQPAELVRVEWTLAQARFQESKGQDAREVYLDAGRMLSDMASDLNDTDRTALQVHPWARQVRKGLGPDPIEEPDPPSGASEEAPAPTPKALPVHRGKRQRRSAAPTPHPRKRTAGGSGS